MSGCLLIAEKSGTLSKTSYVWTLQRGMFLFPWSLKTKVQTSGLRMPFLSLGGHLKKQGISTPPERLS